MDYRNGMTALFVAVVVVCAGMLGAHAESAVRNHPIRTFTFAERGAEIGELYRMGLENNPDHIPHFCDMLKSEDPAVREAAVAQLLFTHDERAVESLAGVMDDPSSKIRRGAIACLRRIGSEKAIPALRGALTYEPPEGYYDESVLGDGYMRSIAAMGMGFYKKHNVPAPTEPAEQEYWNRIAAGVALHELGDDSGKQTVLDCLRSGKGGGMALDAVYLMNVREVVDLAIEALEKGELNTSYLKLIRDLTLDEELPGELIDRVIEMDKTTHMVARQATSAFLAVHGDERIIPLFRGYMESNPAQYKAHNLHAVVEGLKRFKTEESADIIIDYIVMPREKGGQIIPIHPPRIFELACKGLYDMPLTQQQLDKLRTAYAKYESPVDCFMNRLYVGSVVALHGDRQAGRAMLQALQHDDPAVRRIAFKLLTELKVEQARQHLFDAVAVETDFRTFRAMKNYLDAAGLMNDEIGALPDPEFALPPDTYGKPRYIHFNFDDCATTGAMVRFADFVEEMADADARWVANITLAPLSKYDHEYNTYLVQRLFDRGCEIANHTLHHNQPPAGSHLMVSDDQTLRAEIGGNTNWLKAHFMGLDKVYHWHPGGGGYYKPGQKLRTVAEIAAIAAESGIEKGMQYESLNGTEKVEYVDPYAPSYHETIEPAPMKEGGAPPLFPYRDQKDLDFGYVADDAWERIDAFAASFDHWYFNSPDKIMFFMGHDWTNGPVPNRLAHEKHWDILKGFIKDVLLTNRDRYPLAYSVTHLELAHIFNEGVDPGDLLNRTAHLQTRTD
jgi:HEAT repeat protein/peptidoglycan/xylan/chitin deacetylase (PgdA/CDA1 family)